MLFRDGAKRDLVALADLVAKNISAAVLFNDRKAIDILKIDRSFVMHVPEHEDDTAIITTIMAMARTLKMRVVAEGVETAEQLRFLGDLGCDEYQGFFFSPAVPIEIAREILSSSGRTAIPA